MSQSKIVLKDAVFNFKVPHRGVKIYVDRHTSGLNDGRIIYHSMGAKSSSTFARLQLEFTMVANNYAHASLWFECVQMNEHADDSEVFRVPVGTASVALATLLLASKTDAFIKLKLKDSSAVMENTITNKKSVKTTAGFISFKVESIFLSHGLRETKQTLADEIEMFNKLFSDYVNDHYSIYSQTTNDVVLHRMDWLRRKYHCFVTPAYGGPAGLMIPSSLVALLNGYAGVFSEKFYRDLLLLSFAEEGIDPMTLFTAPYGSGSYRRAVIAVARILTILPTLFPYASDQAVKKGYNLHTEVSPMRQAVNKTNFDYQVHEKSQKYEAIDRATFNDFVFYGAIDCEDGGFSAYRLWAFLIRHKNVIKDPLVKEAARVLDQYVCVINKLSCMGDTNSEKNAGVCHVMATLVSREKLANLLQDVQEPLRHYAQECCGSEYPSFVYHKTANIKYAPPIEMPVHSRDMIRKPAKESQYPILPPILYLESTANAPLHHGFFDALVEHESEEFAQKTLRRYNHSEKAWKQIVTRQYPEFRGVSSPSDFPSLRKEDWPLIKPWEKNDSVFYNVFFSADLPGPAVFAAQDGIPYDKKSFVDVVWTLKTSNLIGVYHNTMAYDDPELRMVPVAVMPKETWEAGRIVSWWNHTNIPPAPSNSHFYDYHSFGELQDNRIIAIGYPLKKFSRLEESSDGSTLVMKETRFVLLEKPTIEHPHKEHLQLHTTRQHVLFLNH